MCKTNRVFDCRGTTGEWLAVENESTKAKQVDEMIFSTVHGGRVDTMSKKQPGRPSKGWKRHQTW